MRSGFLHWAHVLFGKPEPTFPEHALALRKHHAPPPNGGNGESCYAARISHQPSKQVPKAVASFASTDRVIFWEGGMENKVLEREQVERNWFIRFAAVLMVGMIAVGALPLLKNTLFPVERIR
jgi:hypothetical protein